MASTSRRRRRTRSIHDALSFEAIYFVNDYDNLVGTVTDSTGGGGQVGDQFDGGEVRVAGIETSAEYRVAVGGVAPHVSELAAGLNRRGHEVHVLATRFDNRAARRQIAAQYSKPAAGMNRPVCRSDGGQLAGLMSQTRAAAGSAPRL